MKKCFFMLACGFTLTAATVFGQIKFEGIELTNGAGSLSLRAPTSGSGIFRFPTPNAASQNILTNLTGQTIEGLLTLGKNGPLGIAGALTLLDGGIPGTSGSITWSSGAFTMPSLSLGTPLSVTSGGTGGASASAARAALGLAIGSDVQGYDLELSALAGLTSAADKLPYFTGSGTAATTNLTSAGRALIDDADAAAQRTTMGLGTIATQSASSVAVIGGSINSTSVGATAPSTGAFTTLGATGDVTLAGRVQGADPIQLDGTTTGDLNYTKFSVTNPTGVRTITIPDASGTLALTSDIPVSPVSGTIGRIAVFNSSSTVGNGDLTGAVTTSGGTATTLTNSAVTYGKIQDVAATKLLGNPTGLPAAPSEIGLGAGLSFSGLNLINSGVTTLAGTVNQITASASTGGVTLSLPATINTNVNGSISGGTVAGSSLTATAASNQIVLGTAATTTLSAVAPGVSRIYTLPDAGANANVVLTASTAGQTIANGLTVTGGEAVTGGILLNGAASVTNAQLSIKNGHLQSQQTTPPTAGTHSGLTVTNFSLTNATDIAGKVTFKVTGSSTGDYVEVLFNQAYATAPIIILSPANGASAAATKIYATSTTTSFRITFSGGANNTYSYFYNVIETQ